MRTTDPTVVANPTLELLAASAGLHYWPDDPDAQDAAWLALLTAVDKIRRELATCRTRWIAELNASGVTAKPCRGCGDWFAVNREGRPRLYCVACKPIRA